MDRSSFLDILSEVWGKRENCSKRQVIVQWRRPCSCPDPQGKRQVEQGTECQEVEEQ